MDKSIETTHLPITPTAVSVGPVPAALFPIDQAKKVYQSLEEAFAAFDLENDGGVEVPLPPIPASADVQSLLMQNALLLVDSGEYSLASNILTEILRCNEKATEALRWLGWCQKQEKNLDLACESYERLVSQRQTDQDFFELGEIYYAKDEDIKAIETWHKALTLCSDESPHLFDLHKNLGNAYTRIGDYDSAEENYNKASTLRTNSDALWVNMGTLAFQKQNYLQAMTHYKQSLEVNPYSDNAWCGVALVAWEMKDFEWARAAAQRALDINPRNEVAKISLDRWNKNGN